MKSFKNAGFKLTKKLWISLSIVLIILVLFISGNPIGYNAAGEREVVETPGGTVWVHFENGYYWKGWFTQTKAYPNVLTVASQSNDGSSQDGHEYSTSIGDLQTRFNDGSVADCEILARFQLPNDELSMVKLHKDYRSPQGLINKGLKPFTGEALRGSSQLMSSEMHYAGGRSQMSQWFQDQLESGLYLLDTEENTEVDSLTGEEKTQYLTKIRMRDGKPVRKKSVLWDYGLVVTDALIADVDYEEKIDLLLSKKIESQTNASIAKTKLVTAQQEQLTAEAEGRKKLVEIEYEQKIKQTEQEVQANTKIMLSTKNLEQQEIDLKAANVQSKKIKTLADAEAYKKQRIMQADGALKQKLEAYTQVQNMWATAFQNYKGALVPSTVMGGGSGAGNAGLTFMDIMTAKAAMDLNLNMNHK